MTMKKPVILFVDDEVDALTSFDLGLTDRGYKVVTATNGDDALKVLQRETPDLIIADLRMEPMNGFEFFQHVKKMSRLAPIPFFFLTAVDDPIAQKYGQTLGVDAYLTKPIDLERLDDKIRSTLSVLRSSPKI
jgi:DNA-binding response OmpR family regulator